MKSSAKDPEIFVRVQIMADWFREGVESGRRPAEPAKPKESLIEFLERMNAPVDISDELKSRLGLKNKGSDKEAK